MRSDKTPEERAAHKREWTRQNLTRQTSLKKAWRARNRDRVANSKLKSRYGITTEERDRRFSDQGSVCAVCKCAGPAGGWVVDHDHETGSVRGILCRLCNILLGAARDNVTALRNAAEYLERAS